VVPRLEWAAVAKEPAELHIHNADPWPSGAAAVAVAVAFVGHGIVILLCC